MTPLAPPAGVHGEPPGGAAGVELVRLPPPFVCHAQFPGAIARIADVDFVLQGVPAAVRHVAAAQMT